MKTWTFSLTTAVVVAMLWGMPAGAGPLEGRWLLVEQTYGSGGSNMILEEEPLRLEFLPEAGSLVGRVWLGNGAGEKRHWPSLLNGDDSRLRVVEIVFAPGKEQVRAVYRIEDEGTSEIVEEYRVSEDGKALTGTVTVSRIRGGEARGSFVLHRRFERLP